MNKLFLYTLFLNFSFPVFSEENTYQRDCGYLYTGFVNYFGQMEAKKLIVHLRNPNFGPTTFMPIAENAPYKNYFMPMKDGGVAARWQTVNWPYVPLNQKTLVETPDEVKINFLTKEETLDKLKKLTEAELELFSATEKIDLVMGRLDFPMTWRELRTRGPLRRVKDPNGTTTLKVEDWEGHCGPGRSAACLTPEPTKAVTIVSPFGQKIKFEPADIKFLTAIAYNWSEKYAAIATPHLAPGLDVDPPHPVAFDMALRALGVKGKFPTVYDVENRGYEKWFEGLVGYTRSLSTPQPLTEVMKSKVPASAKQYVEVQTTVKMVHEYTPDAIDQATTQDVANGIGLKNHTYSYVLFLDENNLAVGGHWNGTKWPDFAFFPAGKGKDAQNHELQGNPFLKFEWLVEKLIAPSSGKTPKEVRDFMNGRLKSIVKVKEYIDEDGNSGVVTDSKVLQDWFNIHLPNLINSIE